MASGECERPEQQLQRCLRSLTLPARQSSGESGVRNSFRNFWRAARRKPAVVPNPRRAYAAPLGRIRWRPLGGQQPELTPIPLGVSARNLDDKRQRTETEPSMPSHQFPVRSLCSNVVASAALLLFATAAGAAEPKEAKKMEKPNLLAKESSPYLLQHAYNPVEWHPWAPQLLKKPRRKASSFFSRSATVPATGATSWRENLSPTKKWRR